MSDSIRIPKPDEKHQDSGRRELKIGGNVLSYHLREISPTDPDKGNATHVITMRHIMIAPSSVIEVDGDIYTVLKLRDPDRTGPPGQRRRFVELLVAKG